MLPSFRTQLTIAPFHCFAAAFAANTAQAVTLNEAVATLCPAIQAEVGKLKTLSLILSMAGNTELGGESGGGRGSSQT